MAGPMAARDCADVLANCSVYVAACGCPMLQLLLEADELLRLEMQR